MVIMAGKKAVENEDLPKVMSFVSENYEDEFGMDYPQLEKWFMSHFRLYDEIKILIPNKKISVKGDFAVCSLRVSIGARDVMTDEYELIYGYSAWGDELILDLKKSDGQWRFTSAHP